MKKLMVIEIATGKVSREYNAKNVKWYPDTENLQKMREHKDHADMYGIICLKGLPYEQDWFEIDKYDFKTA